MMKLLETLQNIQQAHGYLPMEELKKLPWPTAEVVGTASFYSFFRFQLGAVEDHIENRYPCRNAGPLLTARQPYAFPALRAAEQAPESILPLLRAAELRGRGGAGFPVASKWELTKNTPSAEKYVVCNADEGEPGTGKDRAILSLRPETVVDGMAACAKTVGAAKGFLYLRAEYADLRAGIERSIRSAPLQGFDLQVRLGMGAYICGEETALLESLEGRRGEPRLKPPYPGAAGYDGCPTVINNVESFACAARIIAAGGHLDALTKLYTVCGCVSNPGVYEAPEGITAGQLVDMAGGLRDGLSLYAVQVGGGSGRILSPDALDMPMDCDGCRSRGASLGTGGLWCFSSPQSLFDHVVEMTEFYTEESCGCCVPCRAGLPMLAGLLRAEQPDWGRIEALARYIQAGSRCALGQAAVTPVLSWLEEWCDHEA